MVKVLIADDEASTRNGLIDFIPWSQFGVRDIRSAENGEEALNAAREFMPDVVISDIRMPKLSGLEFARRLRRLLPACRIIFLSGYADKENLKQAIELRAVKFLEKPIRRSEVVSAMESISSEIETERKAALDSQRRIEESKLLARRKLAQDFVDGEQSGQIGQRLELSDIDPFEFSRFTSFIIRFDCGGEELAGKLYANQDALCQRISQAFGAFGLCINSPGGAAEIVNHLFSGSGFPEMPIRDLPVIVQEAAGGILGSRVPVFVGIGDTQSDMFRLNRSYAAARIALEDLFYTGFQAVSVFSQKKGLDHPAPQIPGGFENSLHDFDRAGAVAALESFYSQAMANRAPHTAIRKAYSDIAFAIKRFAAETAAEKETGENDVLRYIYEADTIDGIQAHCAGELNAAFEAMESNKESGHIVSLIKRYVHSGYTDNALSIDLLAKKVFMSGTYLCHIFKRKTGMTINSYITAVRLDKARELLKNNMTKVTSVAFMVGYTNPDHFTKLFKKHFGVNPTEYRDICTSGRP